MQREDNLTPLDARNSLLMEREKPDTQTSMFSVTSTGHEHDTKMRTVTHDDYTTDASVGGNLGVPGHNRAVSGDQLYRPLTPMSQNDASRSLMGNAAPLGISRQPTLPVNDGYAAYNPNANAAPYGSAYRYGPNGGGYGY